MASNDINKTIDSISKNIASIKKSIDDLSKSEDKIKDIVDDQLKLDKRLRSLFDEQNRINSNILKQLSEMRDASGTESVQQQKRFRTDTILSVIAIIVSSIAAAASLFPLIH